MTLTSQISWCDELCLTNNARRNHGIVVGFRVQPLDAAKLFDGSLLDKNSLNLTQDGKVAITFNEPVLVTKVVVLHYNDQQRSYNAAKDATIALLDGDGNVKETQTVALDGDPQVRIGTDDHLVWAGRSQAQFSGKHQIITAVSMDIRKKPDAHQACIREVEIWGLPVRMTKMPWRPIDAKVSVNTYSSLRVEWSDLPKETAYIRIRFRQKGTQQRHSACFTKSPGIILGLTPGVTYEVCADARVMSSGKSDAKSPIVSIKLPEPLEVRDVGDVFGMNFYPGGGGAHQQREDETGMTVRICRLMQEAGVKHVRWWQQSPGGAELFAEHGMSLLPSAGTKVDDIKRMVEEDGIWLYEVGSEPDFQNIFAEEYVAALQKARSVAKQVSGRICLIGPGLGGELEGPGSDYVDACYRAGMKGLLDALDIHSYCKVMTPTPPGGHLGGPEGVLNSFKRARQVLVRYGESNLAITAGEMGYPTHEGWWHVPAVSVERQAEWVVRSHLLLIASGVRRIWWYAFQDEGTDRKNPEHNFGIVDWYGNPKPAYFAYEAMVHLLGETRCDGLQTEAKPPVYAVRFRKGKEFITAIWDSGGESEVVLGGEVKAALDMFGKLVDVPKSKGGKVRLTVREKVTYLRSLRPLQIISQRRLHPPIEPQVQMSLKPSTIVFKASETKSWTCHLSGEFDVPVEVRLTMASPWGGGIEPKVIILPPKGKTDIVMTLTAPTDAKKQIKPWDIQCQYRPSGTTQEWRTFRRAIFFQVHGEK